MTFGVARPHSINGAEPIGAGLERSKTNVFNAVYIGREFWNHRNVNSGFDRTHDRLDHLRVLAHGHTIALRVGAG